VRAAAAAAVNVITGGPGAVRQLQQLLELLGVHPLSKCVTADVHYEELTPWDEMAQRVADALLMAQRWCWHSKTREQYDAIAGGLYYGAHCWVVVLDSTI
jgi:hypothetical protein